MKNYLLVFLALLFYIPVKAQDGFTVEFEDDDLSNWIDMTDIYQLDVVDGVLQVTVTKPREWQHFELQFPTIDVSETPYVTLRARASSNVVLRVDMVDANGKVTNLNEVRNNLTGQYQELTFNFQNRFTQQWPVEQRGPVDASRINRLYFLVAPDAAFTGTVWLDDIRIGTATGLDPIPPLPPSIRLNQVGYYPDEKKVAIVTQTSGDFHVVDAVTQDVVHTGALGNAANWQYVAETVRKADFSEFDVPGRYRLRVGDTLFSYVFEIKDQVHHEALRGSLRSYYYQRVSTELLEEHAGRFSRPFGHPDNEVLIHASAATPSRPAGTRVAAPKGWYDAGDYGKYTVPASIATYSLLAMYEHFPSFFDTLNLNIPESGNDIPDLLDECMWNLEWMMAMQSPEGGVYHKLTPLSFDPAVMPHEATAQRYMIGISTSATLDFAAVMAQASRIYRPYEDHYPNLADSMLSMAIRAYDWALQNPNRTFTANPSDVRTGIYGDRELSDEFIWARAELLISTLDPKYYESNDFIREVWYDVPGWQDVKTLGLISLYHHNNSIGYLLAGAPLSVESILDGIAIRYRNYAETSAFGVAMGQQDWQFLWGSNAFAGNQGMVLLQAYRRTGNKRYFDAALANLDYLLGRNGTNYSFLTGYGENSARNPHHRISRADGIDDPVPGLFVGGPHDEAGGDCNNIDYPSTFHASRYLDEYCSFSSNENAVNYNSAFTYLAGAIEALRNNASYFPPLSTTERKAMLSINVFPNPASDKLHVTAPVTGTAMVEILDISGRLVKTDRLNNDGTGLMQLSDLHEGIYLIKVTSEDAAGIVRFVKK